MTTLEYQAYDALNLLKQTYPHESWQWHALHAACLSVQAVAAGSPIEVLDTASREVDEAEFTILDAARILHGYIPRKG